VKYLVTGATGFLGSHLVDLLEARGHEVVPFARSKGGDVLDPDSVKGHARGCDGAFHCAGRVSRRPEHAEEMYRVHVNGTKNVLDACAAVGVRRVVVASTSGTVAVSDDPTHVGTETDPPPLGIIGSWPYYRAKLFAEQAALARSTDACQVICVNPSLLLGPGDINGSSTEDVRLFLEGGLAAVPAGGLSFVDARDAAEAMWLAMDRGHGGERYLVGACNVTVREFVNRLARVAGREAPWLAMPRSRAIARVGASWMKRLASRVGLPHVEPETAEMASCFWYVDSTKAETVLGFRARDPNVTLHETVEDLRARGVVWPRAEDAVGGSERVPVSTTPRRSSGRAVS
jgi:dihydroflavonol-4-reductase